MTAQTHLFRICGGRYGAEGEVLGHHSWHTQAFPQDPLSPAHPHTSLLSRACFGVVGAQGNRVRALPPGPAPGLAHLLPPPVSPVGSAATQDSSETKPSPDRPARFSGRKMFHSAGYSLHARHCGNSVACTQHTELSKASSTLHSSRTLPCPQCDVESFHQTQAGLCDCFSQQNMAKWWLYDFRG